MGTIYGVGGAVALMVFCVCALMCTSTIALGAVG
jgi:hypothetical protein